MTGLPAGLSVTHRRYVPASHAHYGGNLVDGAYVLGLFGDVATELAIRADGDEGLLASYSDVQFLAAAAAATSPSRPVSPAAPTPNAAPRLPASSTSRSSW
jgi:hypothetical protein